MKPLRQRITFELKLNNNTDTDVDNEIIPLDYSNITKMPFETILHDFEISENDAIIEEDAAIRALPSLKDMPLVCQYFETTNYENPNDALGSHGVTLKVDREGDLAIQTNTFAIGVFTEDAFIDTLIDDDGNERSVVKGKGIFWKSRYPDIIGLLEEWNEKNIPIRSSMEILYDEYNVKQGVTTITNYIYEGHAALNSEFRSEEHDVVDPAYKLSQIKFQRLVANAIKRENINSQNFTKKEDDIVGDKVFKKVYELSFDDIRSKLYTIIDATLEEGKYSWIVDVYDDYFIANICGEGEDEYFKFTYTKNNETNEVTVDVETKQEVQRVVSWSLVTELQASLNTANETIESLQTQLNTLAEEKVTLETSKTVLESQLNSKDEAIEELQEFKNTVETEKFEKEMAEKLEVQKSFYSVKFTALNAETKFESEEVQTLIASSINEDDEGKNAKFQLNSMLIDLVEVKDVQKEKPIRELASITENLIPTKTDFDSRYGV